MSDPMQAPLISLPALERAFSVQRIKAYRVATDRDETDGLARYLWNQALVAALNPVLHTLEIAFRNELSRAATKITTGRGFSVDRIPSWLDAKPTMLLQHEYEKVQRAKGKLGSDPLSQTEGHLIGKLDFGFWVSLCRQPYDDSRGDGPRLWPAALNSAFRRRPAAVTTRAQIWHKYDPIREFRNRVAHHEPIWDREYLHHHEGILDGISWMSPKLADATRTMSIAEHVFLGGFEAYRPYAETILGTGAGLADLFGRRLLQLDAPRRALVTSLVNAFLDDIGALPGAVVERWAATAIASPSDPAVASSPTGLSAPS